MRLDKFLKVSRLIKRRTLAKEVAENERIEVNNKKAKASTKVNVGDLIKISFGNKLVTVKVISIQETVKKQDAQSMYEVVKEEKIN